jgi:phosphatidylcholine synthase
VYAVMTALLPDVPLWLTVLSLAYPAYYVGLSLWLTLRSAGRVSAAPSIPT